MENERKTFMVEDGTLHWRNFSGIEKPPFNPAGTRTFCVDLDPDVVEDMISDGWNIKFHKASPEDEGDHIFTDEKGNRFDATRPFIQVRARYDKGRKPRIVMISSTARTNLTEDSIEILDVVDVETVDLIVNGSYYEMNGKSGLKAYLQSMFVTIREDALELKYKINEPSTDRD